MIIFPVLAVLGSTLAIFSDSPFLIIPFLGILTFISFAKFDYALYILLAFLPFSFRFIMLSGTEMQIPTEPLLAVMTLTLFSRWIIMGRNGIKRKFPFRYPLLLYSASLCLSLFNAEYRYAAAKGIIRALAYMMLSLIVFNVITNRERLKRLFIVSIIPATVAVGWTLIFLIDRISLWRWSSAYEGLPFTSYAHYGSFVAVILLILSSRAIFDKKYDRVRWMTLLIFYIIAICFCFSRGVWLSVVIAMGFMLMQRSENISNKRVLIIGGATVFFVILMAIPHISDLILSRISTIVSFRYGTNRERLIRWGTAIAMFLDHPLFGSGYGSFAFSYINDPAILGGTSRYQMGAHNEYLQILAEAGILGFLAWMYLIIAFFRYGVGLLKNLAGYNELSPVYKNLPFWRSLVIGVMAAEMSLLIHFLVNNLIQADIVGIPFWLLIGILPAIGKIIEDENK